ncbi:type IV pilin protein [Azoarcus olearius]|uniref:Conserved hypothetical prepilin like protein n=1 Tax=Azoarcus sp. (strain BH72) TaxID=418699 RepID=A1K7J2_AZOSB|nr:type IV pilin protein [Azoarcus olearius]CAL94797.1 conserved hypothetical prepilin like protein [Azoarcus olearius]
MTTSFASRPFAVARRRGGFSLIELMIVVALIAILASIGWPNYQDYVRKTNRAAAKSFLTEVIQRQQQYMLDARSYADDLSTLGMTVPPDVSRHYTITEPFTIAASPPSVRVTAVAIGSQVPDGNLSLSSTGATTGRW